MLHAFRVFFRGDEMNRLRYSSVYMRNLLLESGKPRS